MAGLLSSDEQERAARFHFEVDRRRFIVGRGLLRTILGQYLEVQPTALRFQYEPQGRPSLAAPERKEKLSFNLSDSGDLAVYALALNRRIGIDLERLRAVPDMLEIAKRFFASEEFDELCSLPGGLQREGFFRCWTRKEAYLKAIGEGLGVPLDQFVVSLASKEVARVVSILGDPEEASRWTLTELAPGADYVAALAVEGQQGRLSCWDSKAFPPLF
ncbi:MAG: 4'-phosphopantetheinyl transferase superfamily protein [Acidobacteriia bacterium]|nr:4'-phosphopantetheinyl transferase superfamily protein [Terriglobia bacterium]